MRLLILLFIGIFPIIAKAQFSNTYVINEIGWTFRPPSGFILIDTSTKYIKVTEKMSIWRKSLFFKDEENIHNSIICSILTGNQNEEEWKKVRPTETKRSYRALADQYPNLNFDSSTTTITIDGIEFQKFSLIGKENKEVKYSHIELARYYNGYKVNFVCNFEDTGIGQKMEKQLLNSKFGK